MLIATGHAFPEWTSMPPVCYRLLGSLDDASVRMLDKGQPLDLSGLSPDQTRLAQTWVLTSMGTKETGASDIMSVGAEALGRGGLRGSFSMHNEALPMIKRAKGSGPNASSLQVATTPLSVVELAENFVNIRNQALTTSIETLMDGKYELGSCDRIQMKMRLTAGAAWQAEAAGPIHLQTDRSQRWSELPKDFLERFQREVAAIDGSQTP
jgi:hypothetical protein